MQQCLVYVSALIAMRGCSTPFPSTIQINARPPNVLLMIIDDMYFMSSMSDPAPSNSTLYDYPTPNLNALYNESVIITTTYAGGPKCSPSRYSLLTGRHASRCEFASKQARREDTDAFGATLSSRFAKIDGNDGIYNLANMLRNDSTNPYYTGMVGKWHLMPANDNGHNYGCSDLADTPDATLYANCTDIVKGFGFDFVDGWYYENIETNDDFSHNPEWMVSRTQKFIEEAQDRDLPFFLYFASTLTHSPDANDALDSYDYYGSPKGTLSGSDVPNDTAMASRADIAASVSFGVSYVWMDDMVGAVMTYLKDNDLFNETVFIFQNDHGMDDKGTLYQGGSRIMNFIRYPPVFGTDGPMIIDSDFVTSNVDIAATIFDLANTTLPDEYILDGVSYWNDAIAVLNDPNTANTTCCDYRFIDVYNSHSIVTADYQYIYRATNTTEGNGRTDPFPNAFDDEQLYDLSADPNQLVNLMDNTSYWVIIDMFQRLMDHYLGDTCPANDPMECIRPRRRYQNYTTTSSSTSTTTTTTSSPATTKSDGPTTSTGITEETTYSAETTATVLVEESTETSTANVTIYMTDDTTRSATDDAVVDISGTNDLRNMQHLFGALFLSAISMIMY